MHRQNKQPKGANSDHLYQKALIANTFTTVDKEWKETPPQQAFRCQYLNKLTFMLKVTTVPFARPA